MATVSDPEDLTVCSICLQTFTKPKYLPCLHTFCELCLQGWIESQVKSEWCLYPQKMVFMCPVCRAETHLPNNATVNNKAEWASIFPNNYIIITLIDKSMIEKEKKACDVCNEMDKDMPATQWCVQCSEAYCGECSTVHRAMKASRKHRLVSLCDVLRDLKILSSDEMCNVHSEEVIKLFCVDHDQPCCSLCGATSHRKCDNVLELSEAAKDVKNKQEFSDLLWNLDKSEKEIEKTSNMLQENLANLDREKEDIERSANELADSIIANTNVLRRGFMEELSGVHARAVSELNTAAEKCTLQKETIKNSRQILEKSRDHSADTELFLQVKRTEEKFKDSEAFIETEMSKITLQHITCSFSPDIEKLNSVSSFGNVSALNKSGPSHEVDPNSGQSYSGPISGLYHTGALPSPYGLISGPSNSGPIYGSI
ncbi:E3 ubiquitin-protein ligase Midline-1-like [Argopecten irradians]|uniref:E3 ubiquitin-protein ligase Midline-1-like n=1 Tax=Argopecten irradians TaxID=31199 RepID=UPI00371B3E53